VATRASLGGSPYDPAEPRPGSPSRSLLEVVKPGHWTVGAEFTFQQRELKHERTVLDMDAWHLMGLAAWEPFRWVSLEAAAGGCAANFENHDGEIGLNWQVRGRLNGPEYVIAKSPVFGKKQSVRLSGLASYEAAQSNGREDFAWDEFRASPYATYAVDLRGPGNWHPYDPLAVSARAGLVYSEVHADWGATEARENHNFGLSGGVALQLAGGFVVDVGLLMLQKDKLSISLGITYSL
jgi:hypothetical protein